VSEDPAELMRAALEEHCRAMSDEEFRLFTAKTRPPSFNQPDAADRRKAISASIAYKSAKYRAIPKDANGRAIPEKGKNSQ
jgi:hypothetical protein